MWSNDNARKRLAKINVLRRWRKADKEEDAWMSMAMSSKGVMQPLEMSFDWRIVPEKPLRRGLNARGVSKYSDVGHVENNISETVQNTASGTIMTGRNHIVRIQRYHSGPSWLTHNKDYVPPIWENRFSELSRARKVKSDAHVTTKKNSDPVQKVFP